MKTTLANNMAKVRHFHKYSQQQASKLIGITRPTLGAYEEGRATPSPEKLAKICRAYSITDVVGFIERQDFNMLLQKDTYVKTMLEEKYFELEGSAKHAVDVLLGID